MIFPVYSYFISTYYPITAFLSSLDPEEELCKLVANPEARRFFVSFVSFIFGTTNYEFCFECCAVTIFFSSNYTICDLWFDLMEPAPESPFDLSRFDITFILLFLCLPNRGLGGRSFDAPLLILLISTSVRGLTSSACFSGRGGISYF